MRFILLSLLIAACGNNNDTPMVDAPPIPPFFHVTGKAEAYSANGATPLAGVRVGGYRSSDEATEVTYTMTDADGLYALDLPTGGQPLDGYFKATKDTYMDTYLYPDGLVKQDLDGARIAMLTPDTFTLLTDTLCGANQQPTNAAIIAIVADDQNTPTAGAMIGSSPAATKYCYDSGGFPNRSATQTDTDGIGYYLNVPAGKVTVNAVKPGLSLPSHAVLARSGVITTTLIRP